MWLVTQITTTLLKSFQFEKNDSNAHRYIICMSAYICIESKTIPSILNGTLLLWPVGMWPGYNVKESQKWFASDSLLAYYLKFEICVYSSPHFYSWHCHTLITFPKFFEMLYISYKHVVQSIFVSALYSRWHQYIFGIYIFVAPLGTKYRNDKHVPWNQDSFSGWSLYVMLKEGKLTKKT